MTNEEFFQQTLVANQKQTEAITAGLRELAVLQAERNALLATQNATLTELRDAADTLVAVVAEASGVDLSADDDEDSEDAD